MRTALLILFALAPLRTFADPTEKTKDDDAVELSDFVVEGGALPIGNMPDAVLNPVEVVTIPGANANARVHGTPDWKRRERDRGLRLHQVPQTFDYVADDGSINPFPSMRATHALLGARFGDDDRMLRVEVYEKHYNDLVELDRTFAAVGGGRGIARGIDVLAKSPLPFDWKGRLTWSFIKTERTDPNTHLLARSPQDITHSIAAIAGRRWRGWQIGVAWRYATGRPFAPITGATTDTYGQVQPVYGPPNSQRLPDMTRVDMSLSHIWPVTFHAAVVSYIALTNILNHANTQGYEYSDDFVTRTATPSISGRGVYFGLSFIQDGTDTSGLAPRKGAAHWHRGGSPFPDTPELAPGLFIFR